jgi:CxxC-x17-CxxC domain-containing protein
MEQNQFEDKTIVCKDCQKEFVWSAREQKFYQDKGFENVPARCPDCRKVKKVERLQAGPHFDAKCSKCGKSDIVPFELEKNLPAYCEKCFEQIKDVK